MHYAASERILRVRQEAYHNPAPPYRCQHRNCLSCIHSFAFLFSPDLHVRPGSFSRECSRNGSEMLILLESIASLLSPKKMGSKVQKAGPSESNSKKTWRPVNRTLVEGRLKARYEPTMT